MPRALSPREQEVVREAARGLTNKEIASALALSEATVGHYWRRILLKLDATNAKQAIAVFFQAPAGAPEPSFSSMTASSSQ